MTAVVTRPLAGRVAVVTGATGGIGSAIGRRLAEAGAAVVVGFRSSETAARELASSLARPAAHEHTIVRADVTDITQLEDLADQIDRRYGRVDVLVNCAGRTRFVPHHDLDALDDGLIDEIFRTNWRGPFATIRALRTLMEKAAGDLEAGGPRVSSLVVNISSVAAVTGIGSNVAYCASKAALNAMTVSLARALAPAIRVVSVSPGLVDTEFIRGLDPAWREEQMRRTPLGRLVLPDEVADAVLASVTSLRFSTGCVIAVDGGKALS